MSNDDPQLDPKMEAFLRSVRPEVQEMYAGMLETVMLLRRMYTAHLEQGWTPAEAFRLVRDFQLGMLKTPPEAGDGFPPKNGNA